MATRLLLLTLLALSACPDPVDLDAHLFACTTHSECGSGAFCADGFCRLFGASLPDVSAETSPDVSPETHSQLETTAVCNAPVTASRFGDRATFLIQEDPATGQKSLRVEFEGLVEVVPLDDDVVGLHAPTSCCEDPCCSLLGPPP